MKPLQVIVTTFPFVLTCATAFVLISPQSSMTIQNTVLNTRPSSALSTSMVESSSVQTTPKKLLVVGGGIGGLSSAFDALHILRPNDEITVVSDRELFQFTPSNPWVATRFRTPDDISLPLNEILPRHGIEFVHGKASCLNPTKQIIKLEDGSLLSYDYLIIATGPKLAYEEIRGASKSNLISVCTTPHASHAADAVDKLVSDPGPVVVGATQGASCFGPAYEFVFLLQTEIKKRGGNELVKACPMTFVTSEPYIGHLGLKGAGESSEILQHRLTKSGIESYPNCKIEAVSSGYVTVTRVDKNKMMKLPSKLTMLIPPFHGQPIWKKVPGLTDADGLIRINEHQQSTQYPNIFGVGVCVSIPPVEKTLVPTGAPKTGYMIESQGTAAVKNIRAMIQHNAEDSKRVDNAILELPSVPLLNGICITDFGKDGAIFLTMPQYPPRRTDLTIHGKIAVTAKIVFEKYFLHKIKTGDTDPAYEKFMLHLIGMDRVRVTPKKDETSPPKK